LGISPLIMNKLIVVTLLIVITQNVFANDRSSSFYVMTSLGKSDFSDMTTESDISAAKANIVSNLNSQFKLQNPESELPGYSAALTADDDGTSISFGVGYIFHKYLSIEASYQYLGSVKVSGQISDEDNNQLDYTKSAVIGGFDLRTFLHTPSFKGFNAFINWGAILWSRESEIQYVFVDKEVTERFKDEGFEAVYGAGFQYLSNTGFGAMLTWEQYNIKQENLGVFKATLLYKFSLPI